MDVPLWAWLTVLGVIVVRLAIDLIAHRTAHEIGLREAANWSVFWVESVLHKRDQRRVRPHFNDFHVIP